jgi:hypothetical protein
MNSTTLISISLTTVLLCISIAAKSEACESPGYIKFKSESAEFLYSHIPPGTCSEIAQNETYPAHARHNPNDATEGTSGGTYERSISSDGQNWEQWVEKTFPIKSSYSVVDWDGDNETAWSINYKFTIYPNHSFAYQVTFTTAEHHLEGRTLVGSHISTDPDSASAASVKTWKVSDPNPPGLPNGTYRTWSTSGTFKLYQLKLGTWTYEYDLPKT